MDVTGKRRRGRPANRDAEYRRIAEALRERLESGEWPHGNPFPSLRTLAKEYAASVICVRQAVSLLREEGRVEPGQGKRFFVRSASGEPSLFSGLVLQVVSSYLDHMLPHPRIRQLQNGFEFGITGQSRSLLIAHHFRYLYALPPDIDRTPCTGIALLGHFRSKVLSAYERNVATVVLLDRPRQGRRLHAASVANEAGAFDATRRLVEMGHRRIAFVRRVLLNSREVDPDSRERQQGFARALKKSGLRVDQRRIINSVSTDTSASASIQSLFDKRARITAVLAVDADKAELVMNAAKERGLLIPRDLSVACFQESQALLPGVSGPRADFETVGFAAAELLKAPKKPYLEKRVPMRWIEGETVASPQE